MLILSLFSDTLRLCRQRFRLLPRSAVMRLTMPYAIREIADAYERAADASVSRHYATRRHTPFRRDDIFSRCR